MSKPVENPAKDSDRRSFLQSGWHWIKLTITLLFLYPVFRFLNFEIPRQLKPVKVHKTLKQGGFIIEEEFIIFDGDKNVWAVSRKCTHLGCRLNIDEKKKILICPCHQSKFTFTGKVISGPAGKDLALFPVEPLNGEDTKGFVVMV
mgnify:CR=1 FL=1